MSKILWSNRKPTADELAEQAAATKAAEEEARDRAIRQAFAEDADPVFFKWQRGEATEADWRAKVEEVKARFPLPSA